MRSLLFEGRIDILPIKGLKSQNDCPFEKALEAFFAEEAADLRKSVNQLAALIVKKDGVAFLALFFLREGTIRGRNRRGK